MNDDFKEASELLWKKQSKENWENFSSALKSSTAKYYKIVFEKGKINKEQDLRKSYAEIYDVKEKLLLKIKL